jgi:hypothetical protein
VWEVAALAALTFLYVAGLNTDVESAAVFLNWVGPILLGAIMGLAMLAQLRTDSNSIWTAMFHFRANILAFFAFGSLVPMLVDETVLNYMQRWNAFTPEQQLKANMIFAGGTLFIMIGAMLCRIALPRLNPKIAGDIARNSMVSNLTLATAFLVAGGFVRYLVMVPQRLEVTTFAIPGSLLVINQAYLVGIFLLMLRALTLRRPDLLALAWVLVAFDVLVGVILFNKSWALSPMMIAVLAYVSHKFTLARLVGLSAVGLVLYNFLVPIATYGRNEAFNATGDLGVASLETRIGIVGRYFTSERPVDSGDWALARFSYLNAASFAVERYDVAHIPGSTYHSVWELLIPRFLWPDKPVRRAGAEFNFAIDGTDTSASTPGLYAEAYWNGGWSYLIWAMMGFGAVLAALSYHALRILRNQAWVFLPLLFVYVLMGHTPGQMLMATLGSLPIMGGMYLGLLLIHRFLQRGGTPQALPAAA